MKTLENKIAVITGASRGIGAAVAKRYAAEGAQTCLIARSTKGLEEVDDAIRSKGGLAPVLIPLDLLEINRIDALGPSLLERFGKLDILVGNAAMLGELSPLTHQDPKNFDKVVNLNVTANYRLLRILDPLLRKSDAGRALFVTSGVTQASYPFWGPYAISKAALEMMINTYAAQIAQTNIKVNLIDPAVVRTDMRAAAMPGEDPETLPHPDEITDIFVKLASDACTHHGERISV